METSVYNNKC